LKVFYASRIVSASEDLAVSNELLPVSQGSTGFWWRYRITFGPALVGLLGGGLTIGIALSAMIPLLKNVANTYAKYPSLPAPWLAQEISLPSIILVPVVILGAVAPFGMGLATAWLVRSKDRWQDISAGLTTALTGSLAAYVASIGWAVSLATVVVPSISDLTLFGDSTKASIEPNGKPSDVLAERYPDLKETAANERGGQFFAKIVSDQVIGSANGVWLGVGLSLATVGLLGFFGTLAGGWLLRGGGSRWSIVVRYAELTVSTSLSAALILSAFLDVGMPITWLGTSCLIATTALVITGSIGRWHWLLRITIAVTWVLVLSGAGIDRRTSTPIAIAAYLAYGTMGCLFLRHWVLHRGRLQLAQV
jgi:hypothetical protein